MLKLPNDTKDVDALGWCRWRVRLHRQHLCWSRCVASSGSLNSNRGGGFSPLWRWCARRLMRRDGCWAGRLRREQRLCWNAWYRDDLGNNCRRNGCNGWRDYHRRNIHNPSRTCGADAWRNNRVYRKWRWCGSNRRQRNSYRCPLRPSRTRNCQTNHQRGQNFRQHSHSHKSPFAARV